MYSQAQIQAFAVRSGCCASSLGISFTRKKAKGVDCIDDEINLKYLIRAKKQLVCYVVPGELVDTDIPCVAIFDLEDYTNIQNISLSVGSDVLYEDSGPFLNVQNLFGDIVSAGLDLNYSATQPAAARVLMVTSPIGILSGTEINLTFEYDSGQQTFVETISFTGGAYTQTEDLNCLTQDDVSQIMRNISSVCGCLCGCNDYLSDITSGTDSDTVITLINPLPVIESDFRFKTVLGQPSYTFGELKNCRIKEVTFGSVPLTSDQYSLVTNSLSGTLTFTFDPALIPDQTEVYVETIAI